MNRRVPVVCGHRGDCASRPEQTIGAYIRAIELGASAIELDVRLSKDGRLIAIHDATVERTTNGTGQVKTMSAETLQGLDAGSWFDPRFSHYRIPMLAEVLDQVSGDFRLCIEIKDDGMAKDVALALGDFLAKSKSNREIVISSFNFDCLAFLKAKLGVIRLVPWMPEDRPADLDRDLYSVKGLQAIGMFHTASLLSREYVEAVRTAGIETWIWSGASRAEIHQAVSLGADVISCGDVEMACSVIREVEST